MSRRQPGHTPLNFPPDWLDRAVIPDVYPRRDDPYSPTGIIPPPAGTPQGAPTLPGAGAQQALFQDYITMPGVRPVAYQRANNFQINVTDSPTPIQTGTYQCDAILISVLSTSVNSTFFGFGSGINSSSGIEVKPGVPQFYSPSNVREQWELQRNLEALVALMGTLVAMQTGGTFTGPGKFMSPRVVMNAHDYYLVNATGITQSVAVMLFTVPEFQ